MADLIITERENITSVANKIRSLTGEANEITLGGMTEQLETANNNKKEIITSFKGYGASLDDNAPMSEVAKIDNMQKVYDSGYAGGKDIWNSYCLKTSEHLDLPDGMTEITQYMFADYTALKSVSMPNTIKEIGPNAFARSSIRIGQFPESLEVISPYAFLNCTNNDVIVFPSSITTIYNTAFQGNENLTEVTFVKTSSKSGTPSELHPTLFSSCPNLTTINVPWDDGEVAGEFDENGNRINWGAENATVVHNFWDGTAEVFTFPQGFVKIPEYMFYNTTKTTSKEIYLNDDCKEIGEAAFYNATNLETVHFPDGLEKLGAYALRYSSSLNCSELPDNVEEIANRAFEGSSISLSKLPASIKELGISCFKDCPNNRFTEIPAGIVRISATAFANNTGLTKLTFTNTPEVDFIEKGIARDAFEGCTNLTEINVPWDEGEVLGAPWGANNATINYNWRIN